MLKPFESSLFKAYWKCSAHQHVAASVHSHLVAEMTHMLKWISGSRLSLKMRHLEFLPSGSRSNKAIGSSLSSHLLSTDHHCLHLVGADISDLLPTIVLLLKVVEHERRLAECYYHEGLLTCRWLCLFLNLYIWPFLQGIAPIGGISVCRDASQLSYFFLKMNTLSYLRADHLPHLVHLIHRLLKKSLHQVFSRDHRLRATLSCRKIV